MQMADITKIKINVGTAVIAAMALAGLAVQWGTTQKTVSNIEKMLEQNIKDGRENNKNLNEKIEKLDDKIYILDRRVSKLEPALGGDPNAFERYGVTK